jgi:hypothetical protein
MTGTTSVGSGRDPGPSSLYAEMVGRKIADRLNATTRPTNREILLEVLLVAVALEGNNGELRFPKNLIDQADMARMAGRRLVSRFDPVTFEYVVNLTKPAATEPTQETLT